MAVSIFRRTYFYQGARCAETFPIKANDYADKWYVGERCAVRVDRNGVSRGSRFYPLPADLGRTYARGRGKHDPGFASRS